ncbi:MAG TPA: hypothetical protein VL371_19885 [Gemmataceae bacterium]|jgi:hypothetical protein|nr:hypothetical protein [Gemmataceae bacterium]
MTRRLRGGLLVCLLLGCGAAGPKTAIVKGTVTYKGKPVPNGTVMFIPASGQHATGEIRPDGSYALSSFRPGDGAIPGKYKVVVVAMQDMAGRLPEDRNPLPPPIVPNKYSSIATTDLTAEVKEGENTIDLPLREDGKSK